MNNKTRLILEGVLAGAVVFETIALLRMQKTCGTLQIDCKSETEKDIYRMEIDDLDGLSKYRYIRLKVNKNADLSQH